jgi:ABC-type multidrug transport system fused ATPase/permease subunit
MMSRFTSDTDALRYVSVQSVVSLFSRFVTVIGVVVMLLLSAAG